MSYFEPALVRCTLVMAEVVQQNLQHHIPNNPSNNKATFSNHHLQTKIYNR